MRYYDKTPKKGLAMKFAPSGLAFIFTYDPVRGSEKEL